jgi:hypothetical protein
LIFDKLRAPATSSKFQTPNSKEAPSSKLKNRPARRLPRHLVLRFGVCDLELLWSLGFGAWCFAQPRRPADEKPIQRFECRNPSVRLTPKRFRHRFLPFRPNKMQDRDQLGYQILLILKQF